MSLESFRRGAMITAVLAALIALAGCQAGSPGAQTPPAPTSAPATPMPAPTDVETPGRASIPQSPVDGGCDALFSDERVVDAAGGADLSDPRELWHVGFETVGGLSCDSAAGQVVIVPADRSSALQEQFGAATCVGDYDSILCTASQIAGRMWVFVATSGYRHENFSTEVPATLIDLLEAVSGVVDDAVPVGVDVAGATELDCDALSDSAGVADLLGNDEIYPDRIEEGAGPIERRLSDALGSALRCDWAELEDFRELGIVVVPGGAWAWGRESSALGDARQVEVAGWEAWIGPDPFGGVAVLVDAGDDLVQVWGREFEEVELIDAAEALLAD